MQRGTIIHLNGTSSSGKSTLAKQLQLVLPGHFLHLGIDQYMERVPASFEAVVDAAQPGEAIGFLWLMHQQRLQETRIGAYGYRMLEGMYRSFVGFAELGVNIIVDDVIFHADVLRMAARILGDQHAYFIGVRCPCEVAEARETARGDRLPGLARAHYDFISALTTYDLLVDTSQLSAEAAAQRILALVESGAAPTALHRLRTSAVLR